MSTRVGAVVISVGALVSRRWSIPRRRWSGACPIAAPSSSTGRVTMSAGQGSVDPRAFGIALDAPSRDIGTGSFAATEVRTRVVPPLATATSRAQRLTIAAVMADVVGVIVGYALARPVHLATGADPAPFLHARATLAWTVAFWAPIFAAYHLYDRRRLGSPAEEARQVLHAVCVATGSVVVFTFFAGVELERGSVAAIWATCLLTVGIVRLVMRKVAHRLNSRGFTAVRAVVVGVNDEARTLARILQRQRWRGYDVAGFVAVEPAGSASVDGRPVLGSVEDIAAVLDRTDAGTVLIAGSAVSSETRSELDRQLQASNVEVQVSLGLPNLAASRLSVQGIDGLAMLSVQPKRLSRRQVVGKRMFDLVTAVTLVILTAPVTALIALAVRLSGPGPVLFRQVRVGEGGRPFTLFKFRSMVVHTEVHLDELTSRNQADGLLFKMADDPRVTRVGRILRRLSLDELPQLLNVIRGEMSLVGPRPALLQEARRYDEQLRNRLRVKPGLTGLWQVNGRHALPFEDYVRYDLFYVENWSLSLDLYIMAKTIPALFSRQGAY